MNRLEIRTIRYDGETNDNKEALKGKYGQAGLPDATFTIIKNLLIVNLMKGANYSDYRLPEVYDGHIQCSDGSVIEVTNSTLNCNLDNNTTGFGILVLKSWN